MESLKKENENLKKRIETLESVVYKLGKYVERNIWTGRGAGGICENIVEKIYEDQRN